MLLASLRHAVLWWLKEMLDESSADDCLGCCSFGYGKNVLVAGWG
jgi:hypothetical protein